MNIHNLSIGQTVKNYKELCSILGESVKGGDAKKAQLTEWETFFQYSKHGHSFTIDHINKIPQSRTTKRFGLVNHIEELILNLLVEENGTALFPKVKLYRILNMVNQNYNYGRYNTRKLSKYLQIPEENIHEFYELTGDTLQRSIESGLNKLKGKSLIFWQHAKTICIANANAQLNINGEIKNGKAVYHNRYGEKETEYNPKVISYQEHREATQDEVKAIMHIEREIMLELNCSSKQHVIKYGKWEEFKSKVDTYLFENYNIDYYYDSYKIIFNEDHVYDVFKELQDLALSDEDKIQREKELNEGVIDKLTDNAKLRHAKSIVKVGAATEENSNRDKRRSDDEYTGHNKELIHNLIDDNPKEEFKEFRRNVRNFVINKNN